VLMGAPSTSAVAATGGVVLRDNQSHVRLQSCALVAGEGNHNNHPDGAPAIDIVDSYSTALIDCDLIGGEGQFSPTLGIVCGDGGAGVFLSNGQVQVGYSTLYGGRGGSNMIGGFA